METVETFDVVIVAFGPHEQTPEQRLQRAFGVNEEVAGKLVSSLPATVQRGVPRVRAEYFRRALTLIAAQAEVRDAAGQAVPELPPEPVPTPSRPPGPMGAVPGVDPALASAPAMAADSHDTYVEPSALAPASARLAEPQRGRTVDPMSQTLAAHAQSTRPVAAVAPDSPAPAEAMRAPAHPTLREGVPAPVLDARPPAPAARAAPAPRPRAPDPPSAWDAPAFGTPVSTPDLVALPRTPSSVWDPPPPAQAAPRAAPPPAPRAAAPLPDPRVAAPAPPAAVRAPAKPPLAAPLEIPSLQPGAAASFDLSRSIAASELWKRSPNEPEHGLALDGDPSAGPLDVLSAWQRPKPGEMAEPVAPKKRASRRPPQNAPDSRRPMGAVAPAYVDPASGQARGPDSGRPKAPAPGGDLAPFAVMSSAPLKLRPAERIAAGVPAPAGAAPAAALPKAAAAPGPTSVAAPDRDVMVPATVGLKSALDRRASLSGLDMRSFWETIGDALALPFRGPAIYWLAGITGWAIAVGVLAFLGSFMLLIGGVVSFFANTSLLGVTCDFYRLCLWAPATGEKSINRSLDFDPVRIMQVYIKSGLHLMFFTIVSQVPLIVWIINGVMDAETGFDLVGLLTDPITWLLIVLPYFYWPMAVGIAALSNDFASVWNLAAGFRAIARAPLEYCCIVAIGAIAFAVSWGGLLLFGSVLGVTGALVSGTVGLPLALSHGMQGALMGHLVRARPEAFE